MSRWTLFCLPAAVLSLAFAPAPFPKFPKGDEPKVLEGIWQRVYPPAAYKKVAKKLLDRDQLELKPGRMIYHGGSWGPLEYAMTIDAKKQFPTYDLVSVNSEPRGQVTCLGIYKLEGDTLTLSYNYAAQGRPTAFEGPGKGAFVVSYKRKKQ